MNRIYLFYNNVIFRFFNRVRNVCRLVVSMYRVVWAISDAPIIHWHVVPLWSWDDYKIAWKELHKAHLKYARILNKKFGYKLYNAGRAPRTKKT